MNNLEQYKGETSFKTSIDLVYMPDPFLPVKSEPKGFYIGPLWRSTFYALECPAHDHVASILLHQRNNMTGLMRDVLALERLLSMGLVQVV